MSSNKVTAAPPTGRRRRFSQLTKRDKIIGQTIEEEMFIFDNLIDLDDKNMGALLRGIDTELMIVALKGANEMLKAKMLGCMSQRAAQSIVDEMEERGPMRLADVIEAVKAFRGDGMADVSNPSVHWKDFSGVPKPVSKPPIMVGGGSPRVLRLAGREADIVSLNFNNRKGLIGPDGVQKSTEDETRKKVGWIREGAGDRFNQLEIEIGAYFTFVMDDPSPILGPFAANFGLSEAEMRKHPHALFGSVGTICEELQRRRELFGISYVTVSKDNMEAFAPVVARLAGK